MKIKFLTVSLMLILPFSVFAANTVVEKAVIESNNTYKAKYNLEDMTEFNQAQKGFIAKPTGQIKSEKGNVIWDFDAFIDVLKSNGIQISMDGKGRWVDNVMVERLWRSVKYEEVYLKAYSSVTDAKKQLSAYFEFYNLKRPHSSLDKMTPNEFYYDQLPQQNKVA